MGMADNGLSKTKGLGDRSAAVMGSAWSLLQSSSMSKQVA